MKIIVPVALSLAATLIAVAVSRLIARAAFRAERAGDGAVAVPTGRPTRSSGRGFRSPFWGVPVPG